jgi:hypothetical protein
MVGGGGAVGEVETNYPTNALAQRSYTDAELGHPCAGEDLSRRLKVIVFKLE